MLPCFGVSPDVSAGGALEIAIGTIAVGSGKFGHFYHSGSYMTLAVKEGLLDGHHVVQFGMGAPAFGEDLYDDIVFYTLNQIGPGVTPVPGCTSPGAANYNPLANDDDGRSPSYVLN